MLPIRTHLKDVVRLRNPADSRMGYLRLDKNENLIDLPEEFVTRLRRELTGEFISSYPELGSLYELLAKWLGCKTDNLYVAAGSDQAIKAVFEVFVDPGDRVAILHPTYAMFSVYAQIFQGRLIQITYPEGLGLCTDDVLKVLVEQRPKLLCIANPNSPTGTILEPEGIQEIVRTAGRQNAIVLLDEAYYYYYPVSAIDMIKQYPHLVVTRSFSKAAGLAAGRLGIAVGHETMVECLLKVRPMYETNAFAAKFAEMLLSDHSIIENNVKKTLEGKALLERGLDSMGISYMKSFTNFVLIEVGSADRSRDIVKQLRDKKILISGGFNPPLERYIRTSVGGEKEMMQFLEGLKEVWQ